jgi:hypothetical protein
MKGGRHEKEHEKDQHCTIGAGNTGGSQGEGFIRREISRRSLREQKDEVGQSPPKAHETESI